MALAHGPHEVAPGEYLWKIAEEHYGSGEYAWDLARWNNVPNPDLIYPGQVLEVPPPEELERSRPAPSYAPALPPPPAPVAEVAVRPQPAPQPRPQALSFGWPAFGPISSYFGPGHPLGIDIDQFSTPRAPVVASAAGVVAFAGGDPCCGYGYWVEIDHGNGYTTRYAHFSAWPAVRPGQWVNAGDLLGYNGRTGYATGYHVHFEIRRNGTPVNPCAWLGC